MQSSNSKLKTIPILFIRLSHYAILLFVIFGWIFLEKKILIAHLIVIPLVILQWKINHGRCLLTDLEHYLLPRKEDQPDLPSEGFIHRIIKTTFKVKLSQTQLMNYIYSVMAISFLISLLKVCIL